MERHPKNNQNPKQIYNQLSHPREKSLPRSQVRQSAKINHFLQHPNSSPLRKHFLPHGLNHRLKLPNNLKNHQMIYHIYNYHTPLSFLEINHQLLIGHLLHQERQILCILKLSKSFLLCQRLIGLGYTTLYLSHLPPIIPLSKHKLCSLTQRNQQDYVHLLPLIMPLQLLQHPTGQVVDIIHKQQPIMLQQPLSLLSIPIYQ